MGKLKIKSVGNNGEDSTARRTAESVAPADGSRTEKKNRRACVVELSTKTLNRIDDIRVDLLNMLPRPWRQGMTEELFIELLLEGLANQYEMGSDDGGFFLIEELRQDFSHLPEYQPKYQSG